MKWHTPPQKRDKKFYKIGPCLQSVIFGDPIGLCLFDLFSLDIFELFFEPNGSGKQSAAEGARKLFRIIKFEGFDPLSKVETFHGCRPFLSEDEASG
jgi:hypothetical protein